MRRHVVMQMHTFDSTRVPVHAHQRTINYKGIQAPLCHQGNLWPHNDRFSQTQFTASQIPGTLQAHERDAHIEIYVLSIWSRGRKPRQPYMDTAK